jgi:hypothetical protein
LSWEIYKFCLCQEQAVWGSLFEGHKFHLTHLLYSLTFYYLKTKILSAPCLKK